MALENGENMKKTLLVFLCIAGVRPCKVLKTLQGLFRTFDQESDLARFFSYFWPGVRPCKVLKTLQGLFRTF
jgi:hypothetical protein